MSKELSITPGCVRGGAAVHAYQSGVHVQDLLWKMRIQHIATLQHYLQEMAAEAVFGKIASSSRESIKSASALLPCFLLILCSCCQGACFGMHTCHVLAPSVALKWPVIYGRSSVAASLLARRIHAVSAAKRAGSSDQDLTLALCSKTGSGA